MPHRFWLPIALLALTTGPALAQGYPGAAYGPGAGPVPEMPMQYPGGGYGPGAGPIPEMPMQNPGTEAVTKLKAGMDKMLAYLEQKDVPNKLQAAAFLDREIAPYFDFAYMAQWAAGPSWSTMSEPDRKAMTATIEASFLSSMSNQMAQYSGQQVRYLRPRPGPAGSVKVPVMILRPGTYPGKLTFRMYHSADGWKVYDVEANGRSVSAYYRTKMNWTGQPVATPSPRPIPAR
jgi:phospholipid transport system substrate-binding protein